MSLSLSRGLKRLGHSVLKCLARSPLAITALQTAALAPPVLKTNLFRRVCSSLAGYAVKEELLFETNLGVAGLRALVPVQKSSYVFGRPEDNVSERATLELTKRLCRSCNCFIDVGAHEGLYALVIGEKQRDKTDFVVHAFEPDPELNRRLSKNLLLSGLKAHVSNSAVSDRDGVQLFYKNLSDDSSGSLTPFFEGKHTLIEIEIPVLPLAGYLEQNKLNKCIIKVDVEGAGLASWLGLRSCVWRVDYLIIEIIQPEADNQLARRIIEDTGWCAYYIRDFDLICSKKGEFDYISPFYNWLFTSLSPDELRRTLDGSSFKVF